MRKVRVERCLIIGPPQGPLKDVQGEWNWTFYGQKVSYWINRHYSELRLGFKHNGLFVSQEIKLHRSTPNYGGIRWWFHCPKCSRRVSRLYKPSQAYCFFCRQCHNLTYESAQSSGRKSEDFFRNVARDLQTTTREARRWVRLTYLKDCYLPEVKRPVINKVRDRRTGVALFITRTARAKGMSL